MTDNAIERVKKKTGDKGAKMVFQCIGLPRPRLQSEIMSAAT